jgi:hypothetical protein
VLFDNMPERLSVECQVLRGSQSVDLLRHLLDTNAWLLCWQLEERQFHMRRSPSQRSTASVSTITPNMTPAVTYAKNALGRRR